MKKLLIIIVSMLIIVPISVSAYGIEDFYINATILDNGDLEVEEYFNLNGEYNGMERIYYYKNSNTIEFDPNSNILGGSTIHNGSDIIIEEVKSVNINHNYNFDYNDGYTFNKVDSANKGDYGVYTLNNVYNGKSILIYLPSKKKKAFYIKYIIKDIAVLHDDVGELGWTIFNTSFNESIYNLKVNINIPNNKNIIKIWAHGPLNGENKIISNNQVQSTINNLDSNTAIDVRVVFDKNVLINSTKKTNINALDKIINYETILADKANGARELNIENKFYELNNVPSRVNYDNVLNSIYEYNSPTKTEEYLNRLYTYKDKVDDYEYEAFNRLLEKPYIISIIKNKKNLNKRILNVNYSSFKEASTYPNRVFNDKLKEIMLEKLKKYKLRLIIQELKYEILYSLLAIVTIFLAYGIVSISKYLCRFRKKTDPLYIRDIPNDLSLISNGILIDKKITSDEVTASILDLIRRKVIIKDNRFDNENIYIKNEELLNNIDNKDKYLLDMIFENEKIINLKKKKKIDVIKFINWKNEYINELKNNNYIVLTNEKTIPINISIIIITILSLISGEYLLGLIIIIIYSTKKYKHYSLLCLLMFANFILIRNVLLENHFFYLSIILNIISIIFIYFQLKKVPHKLNIELTKLGKEKKQQLYALRNFLNDFSRLNEKEIPEVYLWEQYLVYATLFGIGDKVLKSMKLKINENNLDIKLDNIFEDNVHFSSFNQISSNISSMSSPKTEFRSFSSGSDSDWGSYSSSSGSDGGFSGGSDSGGSFGGGSGGGRF